MRAEAEFMAKLRAKIEEFEVADKKTANGEGDMALIDKIDIMWSAARKGADETLAMVYRELTEGAGEEELLKKKERR
jgi:hypothetical protein